MWLWLAPQQDQTILRKAWAEFRRRFKYTTNPWSIVTGPLGTTYCTLATVIGWDPVQPDLWIDRDGQHWRHVHGKSNTTIVREIRRILGADVWECNTSQDDGLGVFAGGGSWNSKSAGSGRVQKRRDPSPSLFLFVCVCVHVCWPRRVFV